jgi:quinoprotein glucose dehydrogenase
LTRTLLLAGHRGNPRYDEAPSLRALDKRTGEQIAKVDVRLGPSTPMTYLHRGRQYIVMATGGGPDAEIVALVLPASGSTP